MSRLAIQPLTRRDVRRAAAVIAKCTPVSRHLKAAQLKALLKLETNLLLTAWWDGELVGTGRAARVVMPGSAPAHRAPDGWYLLGVNVLPSHRRLGVGDALVRARLAWMRQRTHEAWFFTRRSNEASLALHRPYGFEVVREHFWFPGTPFEEGEAVLLRAAL